MGQSRKLLSSLFIILSLFAQGCIGFASTQVERIPRADHTLRAEVTPSVDVVFESTVKGQTELSAADVSEHTRLLFTKIRGDFPFLDDATVGNPAADYELVLQSEVREKTWGSPELTGATLTLFPYFMSMKSRYRVIWKSAGEEILYSHEGTTKLTLVIQLHLIFVSPIALLSLPSLIGPEKKVLGRLLALLERDLARESPENRATLGPPDPGCPPYDLSVPASLNKERP